MAESTKDRIAEALRSHQRATRYLALLVCMAGVVALGVGLSLRQSGLAKVHEVTVLDCPYQGIAAHTHNADCYDADGNLVCPLPERELHIHDDSCYTAETILVCGLEDDPEHVHDESCYETIYTLTCGKEEITEEHVHGAGCFKTILVTDGDEDEAIEAAEQAEPVSREQTLTASLRRPDESGRERDVMLVSVKAPAGALPPSSSLRVTELQAPLSERLQAEVEDVVRRELGQDVLVSQILAADIALLGTDGNKTSPSSTIALKLSADFVRHDAKLVVISLGDADDPAATPALMRDVALANWDDNDTSTGNENSLRLWTSEELCPLAIIEVAAQDGSDELGLELASPEQGELDASEHSGLIEYTLGESSADEGSFPAQRFVGMAGDVKVVAKAPEGAFPAGTTMRVSLVETKEVADAVKEALPGMYEEMVAVDITFYDADGNEVQPLVPIQVTMTNEAESASAAQGQPVVLHMEEDGEASVVAQSALTTSSDQVVFDAETF